MMLVEYAGVKECRRCLGTSEHGLLTFPGRHSFIHSCMHSFPKWIFMGMNSMPSTMLHPGSGQSVINNNNGYNLLSAYYVSGIGLGHSHLSTACPHTTGEQGMYFPYPFLLDNYTGTNSHINSLKTYWSPVPKRHTVRHEFDQHIISALKSTKRDRHTHKQPQSQTVWLP